MKCSPPGRAEGQAGLTASAARKHYRVPNGACTAASSALWPPQQSTTHGVTEKRNCCPPDLEARSRKSWCCPGHSQQGLWGRGWALPIQPLVASRVTRLWPHPSSPCPRGHTACPLFCVSLKRALLTGLKPTQIVQDEVLPNLNLIMSLLIQ